jgi:medium-chain acyl-[acyl-carrier-protein] hydrolase
MHGESAEFERWVFRPSPRDDAALRLICVPYAGGSVVAYHGWAELLPADVELWVIRLPGREARVREPLHTDLIELVAMAAAVCARQLDGMPFCLFGHSLGALVAFEMARELRRAHRAMPTHLAVSARSAPQYPLSYPPIHELPDADFLAALDDRFNAIPPVIRDDCTARDYYLPILRADTAMLETYLYRPEPPLECPIAAFGGLADPEITEANLQGWREQTAGGFTVTMFPGSHFYVRDNRPALVRALGQHLVHALIP